MVQTDQRSHWDFRGGLPPETRAPAACEGPHSTQHLPWTISTLLPLTNHDLQHVFTLDIVILSLGLQVQAVFLGINQIDPRSNAAASYAIVVSERIIPL